MSRALSAWSLPFVLCLPVLAGDARRGADVLTKEHCTECHSINGTGGKLAPDLGSHIARQYTPAVMASVMWNHAPAMWSAMAAKGLERPQIGEEEADDLFAYFYSVRFFDRLGEAERGKRLLVSKHCGECHSPRNGATIAKPIEEWAVMSDPIVLVEQMWNHSALMKHAMAGKNVEWVSLSAQDLADLTVYVQNLPRQRGKPVEFLLPGPEGGEALFKDKGCGGCHTGSLELEKRMSDQTLLDVAAAMWNHAPRMVSAPMISVDEMRLLVSYVWQKQYLGTQGTVAHGRHAFDKKNCATCHNNPKTGAPSIGRDGKVYTPVTMVAVLWKHGPAMLDRMRAEKIAWPRLTPEDVADIVAYLNAHP
jgi:mono/diheme cytochrome c family protein